MYVADSRACPCGHDSRTQTITCYNVHCLPSYKYEIRELTMTDISCELLLYGSAGLGSTISKRVLMLYIRLSTKLADCNLQFSLVSHTVWLWCVCVCD